MRARSPGPVLGPILGGILVLGGLWHAAAPWVMEYSGVQHATTSDVVSGLLLAVFGGLRVIGFRTWPFWVCAALGVWILIAPMALGYNDVGAASNEALWAAAGVFACASIAVVAWRANRTAPVVPAPVNPTPL